MQKLNIAIIGASGYTGVELVRILLNHQGVNIKNLVANSNAGQRVEEIYPHLEPFELPALQKIDEVNFNEIDVVFACLPHGTSQEIIKRLFETFAHLKIIDLSADFRLEDPLNYENWYKNKHVAPHAQQQAVYGLSEINHEKIKSARLIACPGCYPTSILLPLIPLLQNGLIEPSNIIADSKSGVSGAGRSLNQANLFCEANESFKAYGVGGHRHTSEIEQELSKASNQDIEIDFTPHLIPINRGIISTIYVDLAQGIGAQDIQNCLQTRYTDEYFVEVKNGTQPTIADVVATNFCLISVNKARTVNKVVIVSAIDNLCKGASGQAVQNMNLACGFDETMGLEFSPVFP